MFWCAVGLSIAGLVLSGAEPPPLLGGDSAELGKLSYSVEWRLIRAGSVLIDAQAVPNGEFSGNVKLESAGLVSALYKVDDAYVAHFDRNLCASATTLESHEGKRTRRTELTVDREAGKSNYVERDMAKGNVLRSVQLEVPTCVHDVLGALLTLRTLPLQPGQSTQVPITDGRKFAQVKVEAQEREEVATPAGTFKTIRYEANLMNNVVYMRPGRVFIWVTDDAAKIPVQFRLRLAFPVGAVTLQLEKRAGH